MADEVTVAVCNCDSCNGFTANRDPALKEKFTFSTPQKDFKFPAIVNPTPDACSNYTVIIGIFQKGRTTAAQKLRDAGDVIWHLTYVDLTSPELTLRDYVTLCEYLLDVDLNAVIQDEKLAANFLRRITKVFVMTWYSFAVAGDDSAEWAARQIRKVLTHMLGFSAINRHVKNVFCTPDYWPVVSPLDILESLCKHYLYCLESLSLLVNFTRIESMCSELQKRTECLNHIQNQYTQCCKRIQSSDESGGLMLLLFMNLTCVPEFLQFLVEGNNGYFMNIILVDLISNPSNYNDLRVAAWPFLRNLSLLKKGREQIIENLELYLGHVLYPIAGPETLTDEECENLPLEVQLLPETKKRIEDRKIKECILDILYSLCRYKNDRIMLRDANVYHILKHYHKVETDANLLEKLEDLVNVLIRHEGSEIEVDDLLEGLKVGDKEPAKTLTPTMSLPPTNRSQNQPSQPRKPDYPTQSKERNFKIDLTNDFIDDDDLEGENPCTLEFNPEETSKFSYYELQEFHRLRQLLYHVRKEKRIFQSSKPPSTLSDEFIKKKFVEMYGPVNLDDEFFQTRWELVRENINGIKSQPNFEELTYQLFHEGIEVEYVDEDLSQAEQMLEIAINAKFNSTDQQKFKTLNPYVSDGDWFRLPRPNLTSIREQYFVNSNKTSLRYSPKFFNSHSAVSQHQVSTSTSPKMSNSSTTKIVDSNQSIENRSKLDVSSSVKSLINLHVYDPKFDLCFKPPFLILRRERETIEVPKLLSMRIMEHLNRFPLGVSIDMFWEKFYKIHNYLPRVPGVPRLDVLVTIFDSEIYFVKGIDKLPTLMFPNVLKGIVHPEQILKRVWHFIKCLFGSLKCPWIFTENVLDQLKLTYDFEFDPLDWDFHNVNEFLNFCIENFGCIDKFEVYRQNYMEQHIRKFQDFFVINSAFLKDQIATAYGVPKTTKKRRKRGKCMPRNVVTSSQNLDYMTNRLAIGQTFDLDIKTIHNYNHLSCVLIQEYDELWDFHESLQIEPILFQFDLTKAPDPDHLKHGTHVMAYRGFQKTQYEAKWYRGKILHKHPSEDRYFVYGIDFGFMQYVDLKDLRYMPGSEEILDQYAHSIPIELVVKNPLSEDWDKDISVSAFYKLLKEYDYLRATIIGVKFDDLLLCKKWIVKGQLYKSNHEKRYRGDFSLVFQHEYKRKFELKRKRKENSKDGSKAKENEGKLETPDASVSTN